MAAIDKCYVDNYQDYLDFKNWCENKSFVTPRGNKINLKNIYFEYKKEDFENGEERPIFNTPTYIDNYLYHNCPLKFIQDWIQDRYFIKGYRKGDPEDVQKELKLPEYKPCKRVKVLKRGLGNLPWKQRSSYTNKKFGIWWIDVKPEKEYGFFRYNEKKDYWLLPNEEDVWTISSCCSRSSVKAIIRKILKVWKLPKNCIVTIKGRLVNDEWILRTK